MTCFQFNAIYKSILLCYRCSVSLVKTTAEPTGFREHFGSIHHVQNIQHFIYFAANLNVQKNFEQNSQDIHNFKQNQCLKKKMYKKKKYNKAPLPQTSMEYWNTSQIGVSWYDARGKLCFVCWEQAYAWEHVKWQGCVEQCLIVLSLQLVTDRVILIKSATV